MWVSWRGEVVVVKPPGMMNAGVKVGEEQWLAVLGGQRGSALDVNKKGAWA